MIFFNATYTLFLAVYSTNLHHGNCLLQTALGGEKKKKGAQIKLYMLFPWR